MIILQYAKLLTASRTLAVSSPWKEAQMRTSRAGSARPEMLAECWIVCGDLPNTATSQKWNCTRAVPSQRYCMEQKCWRITATDIRKIWYLPYQETLAHSQNFLAYNHLQWGPALSVAIQTPFLTLSWGAAGPGLETKWNVSLTPCSEPLFTGHLKESAAEEDQKQHGGGPLKQKWKPECPGVGWGSWRIISASGGRLSLPYVPGGIMGSKCMSR